MIPSRRRAVAVVAVLALSVSATAVAAAAPAPVDSGVLAVDVTGPGAATVEDDQFVWESERTDLLVTVADLVDESASYYENYHVRVTTEPDARFRPAREDSLAATSITLGELEARTVTLSIPGGELSRGPRTLVVSMYEATSGPAQIVNQTAVPVQVVDKQGDVDGDDLSNVDEVARGTELTTRDTDEDGLGDGHEVTVFNSNPLAADSDGDGVTDPREVRAGANPEAGDTDADGLTDPGELANRSFHDAPDGDLDGLADPDERRAGTDPADRDTDGDGLADGLEVGTVGSDPLAADSDDDGLRDAAEVQRFNSNPLAADSDGDGVADGREAVQGTDPTDAADTLHAVSGAGPVDETDVSSTDWLDAGVANGSDEPFTANDAFAGGDAFTRFDTTRGIAGFVAAVLGGAA